MLDTILLTVAVPVVALHVLSLVTIVGPSRLRRFREDYRTRIRRAAPALGLLGGLLLANNLLRSAGADLSWIIGVNLTGMIYGIEGTFVAVLQSVVPSALTPVFAAIYTVGYVFLLVFPLVAYGILEDTSYIRETAYAYSVNYALGLVFYIIVVAYGPRNLMPDLVEPLLYTAWPESQLLVSEINTNTNVFPSLHTSLAVTVTLMAHRTRRAYPAWFPIATVLAVGVVISTMYLGIHWATDVVAGVILALVAVRVGVYMEAQRPWERGRNTTKETISG